MNSRQVPSCNFDQLQIIKNLNQIHFQNTKCCFFMCLIKTCKCLGGYFDMHSNHFFKPWILVISIHSNMVSKDPNYQNVNFRHLYVSTFENS